jgi:S-DNA-T family DNA segregation ATPase FtsK/SpoIIIE
MAKYIYTKPNPEYLTGSFKKAVSDERFLASDKSVVALGNGVLLDIAKAPHVLVAGTTGSGKSVMLHNIICSLLLKNNPNTARLLLIDPKMVEFKYFYKDSPMLWEDVKTDPYEALSALERASEEMMRRYDIMSEEGKRFWDGAKLYIVVDEVADLIDTAGKKVEKVIANIARLGRGAGVHLIIATQHPTAQVLSRQITANLDTRIALRVEDASASRLVIRSAGANELKGKGDALLRFNGDLYHFQGAYISDEELEAFAHSWSVKEREPMVCSADIPVTVSTGKQRKGFLRSIFG